ncbi:MAG: hypothetical protein JXR22_03670 [Prolixibacteraceae bacterium]|nr:hypothetical protein [Prolixibacteraceae bacterium]
MRSTIVVIIYLFLAVSVSAQDLGLNRNQNQMVNVAADTTGKSKSDVQQVASRIEAWTLGDQYSRKISAVVDTATLGFHNYNPIYRQSISNTHLGYVGSPYLSNIYFDRTHDTRFYFMRYSNAFSRTPEKVEYFNTTTPFANLYYVQGKQATQKTHQVFKAFYTQNIDSVTNFGFRFNVFRTPGQYQLQEARHRFLNVFASRNAPRLNSYFSVVNGTNLINENGGITDTTMNRFVNNFINLNYTRIRIPVRKAAYELPVQLRNQVETSNKSFSMFTSHEYLLGKLPKEFKAEEPLNDSIVVESLQNIRNIDAPSELAFVPKYSIQYNAEFENHKRSVFERTVDQFFFDTTYMKTSNHTDSVFFRRFSHLLQIKAFENEEKRYTFAKRAFIENEWVRVQHPLPDGWRSYAYSNVYAGGELKRTGSDFLNWNVLARFALVGRNLGDAMIKGGIQKELVIFSDTTHLQVEGWYRDQSADIFQEHFYGNHFQWENSFKKQHDVVIRGEYAWPGIKAKAGVNYSLFSNFLYHNELAQPDQYDGEFSLLSAWINKDFQLGRFGWSNKVVWQGLSTDAVLHLPALSIYTGIYYSHYLFKVMQIQLGAEIYYHSRFYADVYEPSTTSFYLQHEILTGGYPLINLYANAKLKRTTAFAQLYHANSVVEMGEFFSAPGYPFDQMAFRFGFSWTFYD